ncbi:MAG: TIGR02206 family membrane protein [Spirochaetia bacterium]|nr:TIGR02206 family membrane protein [Spirochaetia bacterium]
MQSFEHWSPLHFLMLGLTAFIAAGSAWLARRRDGVFAGPIAKGMSLVLLVNAFVYAGYRIVNGYWDVRYDLPMQFCNWSLIVTVWALLTRSQLMAELSYFWVMAGSLQGVITPDLQVSFPHPYFFIFFINHSGLVIASLFVILGLKIIPMRGAPVRAFLYSQVYFGTALALDFLLNTNYGYMRAKPEAASLLDYLGPWPWYLLGLEGVAVVLVAVLYLPFWLINHSRDAAEKTSRDHVTSAG